MLNQNKQRVRYKTKMRVIFEIFNSMRMKILYLHLIDTLGSLDRQYLVRTWLEQHVQVLYNFSASVLLSIL